MGPTRVSNVTLSPRWRRVCSSIAPSWSLIETRVKELPVKAPISIFIDSGIVIYVK